jgi:hypothetical protein
MFFSGSTSDDSIMGKTYLFVYLFYVWNYWAGSDKVWYFRFTLKMYDEFNFYSYNRSSVNPIFKALLIFQEHFFERNLAVHSGTSLWFTNFVSMISMIIILRNERK